jgi:hypothetical protein
MGELAVTAYRWPGYELYLRPMARFYWGSDVRVGKEDAEVTQPNTRTLGGLLGASLLIATDEKGIGTFGMTLSAGLLVARADAGVLGDITVLAPMVLVGFDFNPPLILRCLFWDERCPYFFRLHPG